MSNNISELRLYHETKYAKRVILVTGPVASGKTTVAKNCARNMENPFYFDKDLLTDCTFPIFSFAQVEANRHSAFFEKNIRDVEYISTYRIALEGLKFNKTVIVNAPYSAELHATAGERFERFCKFGRQVHDAGAELIVIYSYVTAELMRQRVEKRAEVDEEARKRDEYILADPNFCPTHALPAPELRPDTVIDRLFVFDSTDSENSYEMLKGVLGLSDRYPYDPKIDEKPKDKKEAE